MIMNNILNSKEHPMLSRKFTKADYDKLPKEVKEKWNRIIFRRSLIDYLWAGEQGAFNAIYFLVGHYKEWEEMLVWLGRNRISGKSLVELFQNESPDGGGYHMGATYILSRLKGLKHGLEGIKIDELI